MTKEQFIEAYTRHLVARYTWAADQKKLVRFIQSVRATLDGGNTWDHHGDAVTAAWRDLGGKGAPTLKALRALP